MTTTLLTAAAISLVASAVYAYVGLRLTERPVADVHRPAAMAFNTWWFAVAGSTLLGALQTTLGGLGVTDLGTHVALTYLNLLFITVALWGLLYYLVYLFTGNAWWGFPLAGAYLLYFLVIIHFVSLLEPMGLEVGAWSVGLDYAVEPTGPVATLLGFLLLTPQMLAALAYGSLVFRVEDRTRRYRILVVSGAILIWFASSLVATSSGASQSDLWPMVSRAIGLAAALAILAAYLPPAWIRTWLGVDRLEDEVADTAPG